MLAPACQCNLCATAVHARWPAVWARRMHACHTRVPNGTAVRLSGLHSHTTVTCVPDWCGTEGTVVHHPSLGPSPRSTRVISWRTAHSHHASSGRATAEKWCSVRVARPRCTCIAKLPRCSRCQDQALFRASTLHDGHGAVLQLPRTRWRVRLALVFHVLDAIAAHDCVSNHMCRRTPPLGGGTRSHVCCAVRA